jgi:hypothetical protein
MVDKRIGGM